MKNVKFFSALFLLVNLVGFSFGATFTSNSNGDWNSAIWTKDGVPGVEIPGSGDDVVITNSVTLSLSGDLTVSSLTLSNSGGFNITTTDANFIFTATNGISTSGDASSFDIGNNVKLTSTNITYANASTFTTGSGSNVNASGTITIPSGADFDINGNLIANSIIFSGDNATFDIDASSTVNSGTVTINGGPNNIIKVYGNLDIANFSLSGGLNNTLSIYPGGDVDISNSISMTGSAGLNIQSSGSLDVIGSVNVGGGNVLTIDGNMTVGDDMTLLDGASVDVAGYLEVADILALNWNSITGDGIISAGTITCSDGSCTDQIGPSILPIELTYFNVFSNKTHITLNWQTATELNNEYFTLERSADGVTYKIIGTVKGAGTSMSLINYSFTDTKPLNGVSYYRLTQTDYDGKFEVFSPVAVSYLNENEIKISSNPSAKEINISMNGEMGKGVANIYNVIGVLVKTIEISDNFTTVNVSDMPKGTYLLVVSANKYQITKRIMVQ